MANVFIKLLLSINLTKITMQTTKLRPLICVTGWLLPPRHEFPHCQIHIMSQFHKPMVLTEALL